MTRSIAASAVVVIAAGVGFVAGNAHPSTLREPVFVSADRALGENADDRPLRSCMIEKAKAVLAKAGASTANGVNYAKLEQYLASSEQSDLQWDSGVLNRATIPWRILAECRSGLMRPNLGVGDLDDDGLPEVVYSTADGVYRIWWNQGAGRFRPEVITTFNNALPADAEPTVLFAPIVIVDADSDGRADIVLTDFMHNQILTLRNLGERSFAPPVATNRGDVAASPLDSNYTVTSADLDKDGRADLIGVTRGIGATLDRARESKTPIRPVRIFYNTGTNGWWKERTLDALPTLERVGLGSSLRTMGGADQSIDPDYQRSGSFTPVVADFNNDGWPDIYVAADYNVPRLFIARDGGRRFDDRTLESQMLEMHPETMGAAAIDWDNDGWMDIIATDVDRNLSVCFGGRTCDPAGGHRLLRNNHDLTFTDLGQDVGLADAGWAYGFSFTDMNLDGYNDLVIGTGDLSTSRAEDTWGTMFQKPYVLLGNGKRFADHSAGLLRELKAVTAMNVVVSADFDGDQRPDLLLSGYENKAPYLLLNRTPGSAATVLVKGIAPTGAEGAVVKIEIDGRKTQIVTLPSFLSNYLVSAGNVPIPVGLPDGKVAKVTVTFASGSTKSIVIEAGHQYILSEGKR